jgi:hypothetical protein
MLRNSFQRFGIDSDCAKSTRTYKLEMKKEIIDDPPFRSKLATVLTLGILPYSVKEEVTVSVTDQTGFDANNTESIVTKVSIVNAVNPYGEGLDLGAKYGISGWDRVLWVEMASKIIKDRESSFVGR